MTDQTTQMIQSTIDENSVVLFMKGSKEMPQCGFSSAVVNALAYLEVDFKDVNVLEDGESQPAGLTLDMINHLLEHGDMSLFQLGQIVQPVVLESGVGTVYSVRGMPVKVVATDADGMPVVPAGYSEGNPVYEPIPVTDLWGNAARY